MLSYAGFFLGENYKLIDPFMDKITNGIVAIVVTAAVIFIVKRLRQKKLQNAIKETEQDLSESSAEEDFPKNS